MLKRQKGGTFGLHELWHDPASKAFSTQAIDPAQNGSVNVRITTYEGPTDRKSTRLNSSHSQISYAVFCLKKKKKKKTNRTRNEQPQPGSSTLRYSVLQATSRVPPGSNMMCHRSARTVHHRQVERR